MSLAVLLSTIAAEAEGHEGNVALETFIFGVIAIAVFGVLALVTFSYRDVANRHTGKAEAYARGQAVEGHGTGHDH